MVQQHFQAFDDDLEQFDRQLDRMLHAIRFPHEHRHRTQTWRPLTDVYETDHAVIVKIEIAGMNPDDFQISFADRVLTVKGNRKDVDEKLSYYCLEIPYGEFQVQVLLPGTFLEDAIEGKYENGYLYITLPRSKQEHRVSVHGNKD